MKTNSLILAAAAGCLLSVQTCFSQPGSSTDAKVSERGANHRIWQQITAVVTNELGEVTEQTSSYTELETGMHRWANGQWTEASADVELTEYGAAATNMAHQVFFAANVNTAPAVVLITPDGKRLSSRIFGLSYFDAATGKAVLLAEIKDSIGLLSDSSRVVYTNAFDDVDADVEYLVTKAGLEQNVVLRRRLPDPSEFELNPASTRLQVLTEFFDPPLPVKASELQATGLVDDALDFGQMRIPRDGRAFSVGTDGKAGEPVRVYKQWTVLEGRTFLVEEVPFNIVEEQIQALSQKPRSASVSPRLQGKGGNVIAALMNVLPKRTTKPTGSKMLMAKWEPDVRSSAFTRSGPPEVGTPNQRKGFLIDYTLLTSQTNFTFACNTNYYISGLVNLSGTTVIEGGTVIKFTNNTSAKISLSGPLICQTEAYRPAVLTSKNDNTVGETITGSTGSPSNASGGTYLYSSVSNPTNAIQYLRLSYAGTALSFDGITNGVWHCQFVNCNNAIDSYNQKEVRLYNVLMAVSSNCIVNSTNIRGQHLTVDVCSNLVSATGASLALTNSILTGVAATGVASPTYEHVVSASGGSGIYQTVGGASYYLADGSTNRNTGVTSINANLATDLKSRTTYPPLVIASNFTADTVLSPQAQRDTDIPDLGYEYDPLDFVIYARTVSANLTITNGVALGTYGASGWYGLGLNSGNFVSEGTPTRLNWVVRYNTVQEQSTTNWSASSVAASVQMLTSAPVVRTRFTGWSIFGATGDHFNDATSSTNLASFSHSRFGGGNFTVNPSWTALTNCLWQRVFLTVKSDDDGVQWYLFNNLFYGGTLSYRERGSSLVLLAYDNLFDSTAISKGSSSSDFTHDYNGYVTNKNRLSPNGTHDVILTNNPVYASSYLGRYYYPTNNGMLSLLINAGSRYATNAGLYHFTTTTNQVKESSSTVDIGFHVVAVDPSTGLPYDTDGDGVPDYLEDRNGNGYGGDDATSWQTYDSPNKLTGTTPFIIYTPLK
jgi:hypothetical protein